MKFRVRTIGILFALVACSIAFAADESLKPATQAAESWLALVDAGQYSQSWDQASSFFQDKITKEEWEQTLNSVRTPLGKVESRQFKAAQYQTNLPGAPDGKYVVIRYRTKFANAGPMLETVTPTLDKDGTWRVSGYFIKPQDDVTPSR